MLDFKRTSAGLKLQFPKSFYPLAAIEKQLQMLPRSTNSRLEATVDDLILTLEATSTDVDRMAQDLFSQLNGYPSFTPTYFRNSPAPLLSCIILLTGNDIFVHRHLIPSIIENSQSYLDRLEIIVVYNGPQSDLGQFKQVKVVQSPEFACVSKGYNLGIQQAQGAYLAIFHDDCAIHDPDWIDKCFQRLEEGFVAVSPQIDQVTNDLLPLAKNVPLFIKKKDILALGGYDEYYYIGYEDLDFTLTMLGAGFEFASVDLTFIHFQGMSTIIMYSKRKELFRHLFGLNVIPKAAISNYQTRYLKQLLKSPEIKLLQKSDFAYLLEKHKPYFKQTEQHKLLEMQSYMAHFQVQRRNHHLLRERAAITDFYRRLTGHFAPPQTSQNRARTVSLGQKQFSLSDLDIETQGKL